MKAEVWLLRRLRFEGEPGLGEEPVDEGGPVLDALEPVPDAPDGPIRSGGPG
jgi:hypothetical protein